MPEFRAFGPPDVDLLGLHGGMVNAANFAGHDLVVLFCPSDPEAAARELADFNELSDDLAYNDAYMVAVCARGTGSPASRIAMTEDVERAWAAFSPCCGKHNPAYPAEGTVLLFGRGGCLRKVWKGTGHANEVSQALGERR